MRGLSPNELEPRVTIERVPLDGEGRLDLGHALRALAARGLTRVFSEGGPRVAARLIALGLADQVALITAERPLGRPGVPALAAEARAALLDGSRYRPVEASLYGPDTMRLWERREGSGRRLPPTRPEGDGESRDGDSGEKQQQRRLFEPCHGRNGHRHGEAKKADPERGQSDPGKKGPRPQ